MITTLKAEKRDLTVKAKKLRREGYTTGVLLGKDRKESMSLQFLEKDAMRFIKENKEGSQAVLEIGSTKTNAIVKNIDYDSMNGHILALDFQELVAGEMISTTAPIRLINEDPAAGILQQELSEIHYKAVPSDLLDTIEIDLKELAPETKNLYVRDLKLPNDKSVEIITPGNALIFHIGDRLSNTMDDDTSDAADTSETKEN